VLHPCRWVLLGEVAAFWVVFSSLLELEQGVVLEAAPGHAGEQGKVFARVGLFACLLGGRLPLPSKAGKQLVSKRPLPVRVRLTSTT